MSAFEIAAAVLLVALGVCGAAMLRADLGSRLVATQMAASIATFITLLLSAGFGRGFYVDVALVLAVTSVAGGLVYARQFERWL